MKTINLSEVRDKGENLEKAIEACDEALVVYTRSDFPYQYAGTQNNRGNAYRNLADVRDEAENLEKALEAFDEALKAAIASNNRAAQELAGRNLSVVRALVEGGEPQ